MNERARREMMRARMSLQSGRDIHTEYTDRLVFIGATVREAWQDYVDHRLAWPEHFLGYRVRVVAATYAERLWGLDVASVIITERSMQMRPSRINEQMVRAMYTHPLAKTKEPTPQRVEVGVNGHVRVNTRIYFAAHEIVESDEA